MFITILTAIKKKCSTVKENNTKTVTCWTSFFKESKLFGRSLAKDWGCGVKAARAKCTEEQQNKHLKDGIWLNRAKKTLGWMVIMVVERSPHWWLAAFGYISVLHLQLFLPGAKLQHDGKKSRLNQCDFLVTIPFFCIIEHAISSPTVISSPNKTIPKDVWYLIKPWTSPVF